jgi:hypothetical protein
MPKKRTRRHKQRRTKKRRGGRPLSPAEMGSISKSFNNTIRKIIGTTTKLSQELSDFNGTEVSTTYTEGAEAYKLDFTIFGQQSGFTFTPVLGGVSGTTITENGIYHQIFYITPDEPIENSRFILINPTDYIVINDAGDALIWE